MSNGPRLLSIAGQHLEVEQITVSHPQGTIVLLHEALGSVSHWRDFPKRLASQVQRNVLVYSRRGHGRSEGSAAVRTRTHYEREAMEVLPALLDHFGIDRAVLLGHSEGAAIALLFAARHQPRVPALILESPILVLEPASEAGMAMAEAAYQGTDFRERLSRHHRDPDGVFSAWLSIREAESLLDRPLQQVFPQLGMPVLMVQGERDEYATAAQAEALRPIAPHLELLRLRDIGHTPHREQPDRVLEAISEFLMRVKGSPEHE